MTTKVYTETELESTCEGDDCQGCEDCPNVSIGRSADAINKEHDEWVEAHILACMEPEQREMYLRTKDEPQPAIQIHEGKTSAGLEQCLFWLGLNLRYNTRAHSVEWRKMGSKWQQLSDRKSIALREEINATFTGPDDKPLTFGRDAWQDAISALLYRNEVDPFKAWLDALPVWDRQHRAGYTLEQCFTIHDDDFELAHWASLNLVMGAVLRTLQPGAKLDEIAVLIGDGGIGKSTFLRELLPPDMPDLFSDTLNLASQNKERVESTLGRVIVEISEMAGSTRADQESLKAYISRTDDGSVRLAFRRNPEPLRRMFILAGTADRNEPLPNDRNLRRFVPVRLMAGNVAKMRAWLDAERLQIWAEALYRVKVLGEHPRLPDELKEQQKAATTAARSKDVPMEDAIARFVQDGVSDFTLAEVAAAINLIPSAEDIARLQMRDSHRIGSALRAMGYEPKRERKGGRAQQRWYLA